MRDFGFGRERENDDVTGWREDGGSIQGAGSFMNADATPTARGPCVGEGMGKRPRVV